MKDIKWVVLGARRWARNIVEEILKILPEHENVHLLSASGDVIHWWETHPNKTRIQLVTNFPSLSPEEIGIAIIANSSYLHASSASEALDRGYNVVCEKPLTFSTSDTNALIKKAKAKYLKLFSTNTYLFAHYLDSFKENHLKKHKFSRIIIHWEDPKDEFRHGATKRYDSSTPIIYDVLPHITCILLATQGHFEPILTKLDFHAGGSHVNMDINTQDNKTISVVLKRNATARKRLITLSNSDTSISLDFTQEPGVISYQSEPPHPNECNWPNVQKPISAMLTATLGYIQGLGEDPRLCAGTAILANQLIDSIAPAYIKAHQNLMHAQEQASDAYRYASKESTAIQNRVIPHLSESCPLVSLAGNAANSIYCFSYEGK